MTSGNKTNADVAAIAQILHGKAEPKRAVLPVGNLWKGTKKVMSPQKPKQGRVLGTGRGVPQAPEVALVEVAAMLAGRVLWQ